MNLSSSSSASSPDSWRVVATDSGRALRWRDFVDMLASHDAVFVGEQHDDPQTHLLEARLFSDLSGHPKVRNRIALAMEMLERDGQSALDDYLSGRTDEATFSKRATLWKTYPTDYRPMVEHAKSRKIPVVGSNAPQKLVRLVGRGGVDAIASFSPDERKQIATTINAPMNDSYQKRFFAVMSGDGGAHGMTMDAATVKKVYEAQCVRDDTMAESVADLLGAGRFVYHVNGSFHSDAGLGTAARVLWRRPLSTRLAIVKVVPTTGDLRAADPAPLKTEAHFVAFVPDTRPPTK